MKKFILLSLLLCVFSACNNYTQFYTDLTEGKDILENPRIIISMDDPILKVGIDVDQDTKQMLEDGYALIGVSSFNAGAVNQKDAIAQARIVHADTVIVYSQYTNTITGSMPLTVPDTQTSTGFHSGSIYGSGGGYANYSGSSYTTTYGTRTTYMPYAVRRYDYHASYWVKMKPPRLGIYFEDLTEEHRKEIESNKGVYITIVIKDSPAFRNDLLTDDIIRKFNDVEIIDYHHLLNLLDEVEDREIKLEIFRDGKVIIKSIQLSY